MTVWPSNIPDDYERRGFQETLPNNVVKTAMDAGPPKRRRTFTAGVSYIKGTIIMTDSEFDDLETFYYDTLKETGEFDFIHPRTEATVVAVFNEPPGLSYFGTGEWRVSVSLEIQP